MTSFRAQLAVRMALSALGLFIAIGLACVLALRALLHNQLDGTLLHLAEVEAQAGAATTGSDFEFHEGVLLAAREGSTAELTRFAQLWTSDGMPLVRSMNLPGNLELPEEALTAARGGEIGWATHKRKGQWIRSVVYPLRLVGSAHGVHLLQVAAPLEPVRRTIYQFALFLTGITAFAATLAFGLGWRLAGAALRPTREITTQAETITAGTLSDRITAHAEVAEFSRLVTVLNGMLQRLDQAFQAERRFTADAGHELRAPLTVLRGDIDVALKRERSPAEYRETLVRCRDEVVLLSRLAADLLTLARTDAGLPLEHREEVDLLTLVHVVAERFVTVAAERGIRIVADGEPAVVTGDALALERAVSNLVDNAIKHSGRGGFVTLRVDRTDPATVTVSDDGVGVAAHQVSQLFMRFFRGDPARPRDTGYGLGLAIARAAAESHGGTLQYLGNAPGAVFRLTLPNAT